MIDLSISTRLINFDIAIDEAAFDGFIDDLLEASGALPGILSGFDPEAVTGFGETGFAWAWNDPTLGALTLDVVGAGLGPVDTPARFLDAVLGGTATGAITDVVLAAGGDALLAVQFGAAAVSVTLGRSVLTLEGGFPTDVNALGGLLPALLGLSGGLDTDLEALLDLFDTVAAGLQDVTIHGIDLTHAGTALLSLTQTATEVALGIAGGLSAVVRGGFPGDLLSLGEAALGPLLSGGAPDFDAPALEGLSIDDIVVRDARGRLLKATGDFSDPALGTIEVLGTGRRDVADMRLLDLLGIGGGTEMSGRGGADVLGGTDGRDVINGNKGNDLLRGFGGRDEIFGAQGNDTLDGGRGNDTLTGGAGADEFRFIGARIGHDTVTDFRNNRDQIVLDDRLWGGADLTERQVVRRFGEVNEDGDVVLVFDARHSITFEGISARGVLTDDIVIV